MAANRQAQAQPPDILQPYFNHINTQNHITQQQIRQLFTQHINYYTQKILEGEKQTKSLQEANQNLGQSNYRLQRKLGEIQLQHDESDSILSVVALRLAKEWRIRNGSDEDIREQFLEKGLDKQVVDRIMETVEFCEELRHNNNSSRPATRSRSCSTRDE